MLKPDLRSWEGEGESNHAPAAEPVNTKHEKFSQSRKGLV